MDNYVITIARGFGSGGKYIGTRLSEELGIPCYDRQILTLASKESGIDESEFVEVNEKLRGSYLKNVLTKIPYGNLFEPQDREFISDINLYNIQAEIIRELAREQSCIIIGKCADHILEKRSNVISVYVEANRQDCIQSTVDKLYVSEERAVQLIRKTDKYRTNYYKYYTQGKNWRNTTNYDMVLNTSRVSRAKCVKLIKEYLKIKFANE